MARISIDTTVSHEQNEAYGFTGLDLSLQGATAGNAARIAFLAALRGRLGSCYGGAVDKYKHEVTSGDSQYNMIPSEITALGQNPATLQDGVALTSPGFGFTDDLLSCMYQMGVRKMVYVANIVPPLIPYIGGAINYAALDYTDVANEFIIFRNKCAAYGITVPMVQGCLETNVGNFTDVFSEGGITYGKVMDKLITKLKDIDPAIKVYLDAYNFYDTSNPWATWTEDTIDNISAPNLAYVFGIRNYLNFDDSYNTLADALTYGDTLPDMVTYARSFNADWKVNFQQLTVKNSNDLRGTCAQGIVTVNAFINALQLQIDENNPFDIINFQSINSVSNQYPETINPVYEYLKRFGRLSAGELIEVDLTDFPNCKGIASIDGNTLTLGILNYGSSTYNIEGIDINGIENENGIYDQVYAPDDDSASENPAFSSGTELKSFSMTEIVFDLSETGTDTLRYFRGTNESDINTQLETFLTDELNGNGIVSNFTISYERSLILVGLELSYGIPNIDTKIKVFVDSVTSNLQTRANTYYQEQVLLGFNSNSIVNDKYINYSKTAIGNSNESAIVCIANPAGYLNSGNSEGSGVTNLSQTLFVSKLGVDADAIRGNISKPFLTLNAAIAAAVSGDNIIVYSGDYTASSNLAKVGVSWFFNNCTVTHSGTAFNLNSFTGILSVKGKVNFTCSDSFIKNDFALEEYDLDIDVYDVTAGGNTCILILSIGTRFDIKFNTITAQLPISIQTEAEGAIVNIKGRKCIGNLDYCLFVAANGNEVIHNVCIDYLFTSDQTAFHSINCKFSSNFVFGKVETNGNNRSMVSANCNGKLNITVALATTPVTFQNTAAGGLYLDLNGYIEMQPGGTNDSIFNCILNFSGTLNCNVRINGGFNNFVLAGGLPVVPSFNHNDGITVLRYLGADLSAQNSAGSILASCHRLNVSGGILKVTGYMFEACDNNVRLAHTISNGELIMENLLLYTQSGTPGVGSNWELIALTGGKLNINNSSFRNRLNGSSTLAYVINKSGGTMILRGAVLVTDAGSSDSIHATGGQTIKIYGNSFTNKATGGGAITYQVGTVANLIVDANVTI